MSEPLIAQNQTVHNVTGATTSVNNLSTFGSGS
jgi:hypothetical protein